MRTKEFWKERLHKAEKEAEKFRRDIRSLTYAYKYHFPENLPRLRNLYGHRCSGANMEYTKAFFRRKLWFRNRSRYLTKIGKAQRKLKSIEKNRIPWIKYMLDPNYVFEG